MFFLKKFLFLLSGNLCQYDNQTDGINQSIITRNCEEKCDFNFRNGTSFLICKPLCKIEKDPKCDQYSETITEYQAPVNGSNCTCTKKKCIPGMISEYSLNLQQLRYLSQGFKWKVLENQVK